MSSSWAGEEAGKGHVAHKVTSLVKAYRQGGREDVDDGKEFTVLGAEHRGGQRGGERMKGQAEGSSLRACQPSQVV